jgi:hypothetical protein
VIGMKWIELRSIEDLAYIASSSPFGATIQHFKDEKDNNIYFLIGGTRAETLIYFVKREEIKKRFINLDVTKNKIEYTDLPILDPKIKVTSIIEVKKQNLIDFKFD